MIDHDKRWRRRRADDWHTQKHVKFWVVDRERKLFPVWRSKVQALSEHLKGVALTDVGFLLVRPHTVADIQIPHDSAFIGFRSSVYSGTVWWWFTMC